MYVFIYEMSNGDRWTVEMMGLRACVHVYEGHIAYITVDLAINTHCPERYRNNWLTCYFFYSLLSTLLLLCMYIRSSSCPANCQGLSTKFTTKVIILSLIYRSPVFTPVFFFFFFRHPQVVKCFSQKR